MPEVTRLLAEHAALLRQAVQLFGSVLDNPACDDAFSTYLFAKSPPLIAAAIAESAGEPDKASLVGQLPAGFQLRAFSAVVRLTMAGINPAAIHAELSAAVTPLVAGGDTKH